MQPTGEQRPAAGVIRSEAAQRAAEARDDILSPFQGGRAVPAQMSEHYNRAAQELSGYLGVLSAADDGEPWVTREVMQSATVRGLKAISTLLRVADISHVDVPDLAALARVVQANVPDVRSSIVDDMTNGGGR